MSILIHDFKQGWQNAAHQAKMRSDALYRLLDMELDEVGSLRCRHLQEEHPFFKTQTITSEISNVYKLEIEGTGVYLIYYTYGAYLYRYKSNTNVTTLLSSAMQSGGHVSFAALRPNLSDKTHVYYTDGVTMAADNGNSNITWGIDAPIEPLIASAQGSGGSLSAGDYVYVYTYYDDDRGIESDPSPASGIETAVDDDQIDLTSIGTSPNSRVSSRRIYRTKANGGTKYFVKTIPDNSTTSDSDVMDDDDLGDAVNDDQGTPPTIDCVHSFKERLWMCGDSNYPYRVWFTDNQKPDNVASTNYVDLDRRFGKVQNFAVLHGVLYFVQKSGISRLYGETTDVFTPGETNSHVGAYGRWTVAVGPDGIYFLGPDGVYKFNGLQSVRVSDPIARTFGKITDDWTSVWAKTSAELEAKACFLNGRYYLQLPLTSEAGSTANKLLVLDVMHAAENQTWELHDIPTDCLFADQDAGQVLAGREKLDGSNYSVYKVGESIRNEDDTPDCELVTRAYRLGKPSSWAEDKRAHLISVEEPALDFIKEYRLDVEGTWTITFYVDGVNRYTKQHSSLDESDRTTWYHVDPKIKGGQCYIKLEAGGTPQPATSKIHEVEIR